MKNISTLILAGGESRRMKQPKAFLKFDKNRSFLEKITDEYLRAGLNNIILVINAFSLSDDNEFILSKLSKKITIIYNKNPEKGRIYSLKLGLLKLNDPKNIFIQNIDNPFVNSELLIKMVPLLKPKSYVSPSNNSKGGHPILISNIIGNKILDNKDTSITLRNILKKFNKVLIPADKSVLININTAKDYAKYFSLK